MKKLKSTILLFCLTAGCWAQECDLPMGVAFLADAEPMPAAVQRSITGKLRQVLTQNGISGGITTNQFALVPVFDVVSKHIVPGPPAQTVYNLNFRLEVRETATNTVFASYSADVNAVGENQTKAYQEAVRQLAPASKPIKEFVEQSRQKIVAYYEKNYETLAARARSLLAMNQHEEALCLMLSVPECCSHYAKAQAATLEIFQKYVDYAGERLLQEARAIWSANNNRKDANEAALLLTQIEPSSSAYKPAAKLLDEMKEKASANEPWDFRMKAYNDLISIEQQRIEAAKSVGVAFGQNQQPSTTNLMFAH